MKDYLSQYLTGGAARISKRDEAAEPTKAADSIASESYQPPDTYTDELTKLTEPNVLPVLDSSVSFVSDQPLEYPGIESEVAWRVQAMLPQIPDSGPVPFLIARKEVNCGPGKCPCCGDDLDTGGGFRCGLCSRAVNLALEIALARKPDATSDERSE
jgi:hypothetical protein